MIHEIYKCKHSNEEIIGNIAKRAILSINEKSAIQNRDPSSNLTSSMFIGNFFLLKWSSTLIKILLIRVSPGNNSYMFINVRFCFMISNYFDL